MQGRAVSSGLPNLSKGNSSVTRQGCFSSLGFCFIGRVLSGLLRSTFQKTKG